MSSSSGLRETFNFVVSLETEVSASRARGFWREQLFLTIPKLCFDPFALRAVFTRINNNNNNIQAPGSSPELRLNYFFDRAIRSVDIFRAGEAADGSGKNK